MKGDNGLNVTPGAQIVEAAAGYLHPSYAESLAEFGKPRHLPRCSGWILERPIAGSSYRDGMGCYPLFACRDWRKLGADLEEMGDDLVCLSLVTDPFGAYDVDLLQRCFSDLVRPFKKHYVIDLRQPLESFVSAHHNRYARRSLRVAQVEQCQDPIQFLEDWLDLYSQLIKRHNIRGLPAFSKVAFAKQLQVPGIVMFRAVHNHETVGMLLWYEQRDVGYYHLGAFSITGYKLRVSFALFWHAIEHFSLRRTTQWLDLGGSAGVAQDNRDGLSRFKQGWATGTRTAYLCGRILDPAKYAEITQARQAELTSYFPAYRLGEFGE